MLSAKKNNKGPLAMQENERHAYRFLLEHYMKTEGIRSKDELFDSSYEQVLDKIQELTGEAPTEDMRHAADFSFQEHPQGMGMHTEPGRFLYEFSY